MKAVILNASPRKSGSTSIVLGVLGERITAEYETETIELGAKSIAPCAGCLGCRPNGACVLPRDEAHRIGERIAECDLLVIGTPCYWGNVPSTLKAVLDRNVTTFEHFLDGMPKAKLAGKKAVIVMTSGSSFPGSRSLRQMGGTLNALRIAMHAGGIRIIDVARFDSSWKLDVSNPATRKKIDRIRIR